MSRAIVFPFLTAAQESVSALWAFKPESDSRGIIESWDVSSDVIASISARIDLAAIREQCRLSTGARIAASLCWKSRGTSLRGQLASTKLSLLAPTEEIALSGTVLGSSSAQEIEFSLILHLLGRPKHVLDRLSPSEDGAILWRSSRKVLIEGEAARFPVEGRAFSSSSLPGGAPWFLDWTATNLEDPLLGGVRLLLNSEHPAAAEITSESESGTLWREFMRLDVATQLIRGCLLQEEFRTSPTAYSEGSIGAHVNALITTFLPGHSARTLFSMSQHEPNRFHAELAAAFRIGAL